MLSRVRFLHLRRAAALALASLTLLAGAALGSAPPAGAHPGMGRGGPVRSYLALGDSLAFGYQRAKFEANKPSESPAVFDTGYVDDLAAALRARYPSLQVVNDGCPGETTDSFIAGPCQYQLAFPLHHPYPGSQLSDALAYLAAHRNFVNPITLDIGANDALGVTVGVCHLQAACIAEQAPALFAHIAANLHTILTDLRQAAPHAKIVVLGLYNPFAGLVVGGDQLTEQLNQVLASGAAAVGAGFADPLAEFNPPGPDEEATVCLLTNMCEGGHVSLEGDIHPTDLGYSTLAGLLLEQLFATPPFGVPFLGR